MSARRTINYVIKKWASHFVYADDQVIKTDQMNILIRSLTLKKQQGDATESSRKRCSIFFLFFAVCIYS